MLSTVILVYSFPLFGAWILVPSFDLYQLQWFYTFYSGQVWSNWNQIKGRYILTVGFCKASWRPVSGTRRGYGQSWEKAQLQDKWLERSNVGAKSSNKTSFSN